MNGAGHDRGFWWSLAAMAALLGGFLLALLATTAAHSSPSHLREALASREIQFAIRLSLITCTVAAAAALVFAVPIGYLLSRGRFRGRSALDALFDIPIVLPPMVLGLCLLVLFQTGAGRLLEHWVKFTYQAAGVVLAQFVIGAAFAVRIMKQTFDHLPPRIEDVAMTLGCSRLQAVGWVTLPAARRGMVAAFSVAWARSLGEFGPVLVFAGSTRLKTEVLPTTIWLELSVGNLEAAIAVSLIQVALALVVMLVIRLTGEGAADIDRAGAGPP
jgi:molybdate transport system permease protein